MLAQLNLEEYFVDDIRVRCNTDYLEGNTLTGEIKEPEFSIRRNHDNPLKFLISMSLDINPRDETFTASNYQIHITINGFFCFDEGTDEETIDKMIAPSGLSILYGVARGVVAQFTANCRYGKFLLPSLNMSTVLKSKATKVASEGLKKKPGKKALK